MKILFVCSGNIARSQMAKATCNRLAGAPNYVHWEIADPRGRSYKITETTFWKVEAKVRELLAENEQKL